jgi:hypothetical protein
MKTYNLFHFIYHYHYFIIISDQIISLYHFISIDELHHFSPYPHDQRPRSAVLISRLKNIVGWFVVREKHYYGWKNKLKSTNYKPDEQGQNPRSATDLNDQDVSLRVRMTQLNKFKDHQCTLLKI